MNKIITTIFVVCVATLAGTASAETVTEKFYSGTGDGYVLTQPYPASWEIQHPDVVGREADLPTDRGWANIAFFSTNSGFLGIHRGFLAFDTSAIPDDADIVSANLNLYLTNVDDSFDDEHAYINVYEGMQGSSSDLVNADIDNCGDALINPTKGSSDTDISSLTQGTFESFSLNATGLDWIAVNGHTKLCLREGHDTGNQPVVDFNDNVWTHSGIGFAVSQALGTSTDPYLEVTYTIPDQGGDDEISEKFDELRGQIEILEFPNRVENVFLKNLEQAEAKVNEGKKRQAIKKLHAFNWMVKVGKTLGLFTKDEKKEIIECVRELIKLIREADNEEEGEPEV